MGPEGERQRLQEIEALHELPRARVLKIADKLSNVRKMTEDPSVTWTAAQCLDDAQWAERVVAGLRGPAARIEGEFDAAMSLARLRFAP